VEIRHREREVSIEPGAQEAEGRQKLAEQKAGKGKAGKQRGRRAKNGAAARLVESDLLAKISLELRAPLNSIIGFAELMKDKRLGEIDNPHYESYIRDIHDSGKLTLSLIEDLLVIARARAGTLALDVAPVDLGELAAQAVAANQALAQERRVFLRLAPCNGVPPVLAERESLARAVNILLAGALRASPPGGQVIISLRRKRSGALRLRVHDNGEPLSGKELARALDPFAYSETTPIARSGNGLALPLAKALAQANGAKFKLKSSHRKGTRADLIFPADRLVPS